MPSEPRWHWRNCRDIGIGVQFWPLMWKLGAVRDTDVYGGEWRLDLGPFTLIVFANIGNCSSENRFEAWRGLSLEEAWNRAIRFEGGDHD
ncbi:hypothetical protein [Prosthecomicrobium hirschii]|uniref:hypothetical protein n=1 Tax=Prosthecodimorpha hirschii TaxID=665126 RepID=UPI00221F8BD0|nr:hypothetical protein [Prosthecomicrobium hirschii]MCW1844196.1 hypothetical protein [Prosthecomicrobium hirschii]